MSPISSKWLQKGTSLVNDVNRNLIIDRKFDFSKKVYISFPIKNKKLIKKLLKILKEKKIQTIPIFKSSFVVCKISKFELEDNYFQELSFRILLSEEDLNNLNSKVTINKDTINKLLIDIF